MALLGQWCSSVLLCDVNNSSNVDNLIWDAIQTVLYDF